MESPGSKHEGNVIISPGSNATEAVNNLELVVIPTDLTPGAELENYVASDLSSEEGVKFTATLTIKECDAEDALNKYYLVVENSEGSQRYSYSLTVTDKDETTESSTEGGGGTTTGAHFNTHKHHKGRHPKHHKQHHHNHHHGLIWRIFHHHG